MPSDPEISLFKISPGSPGLVAQLVSVLPLCQGGQFILQSVNLQEAANEWIHKQNNSLFQINKWN